MGVPRMMRDDGMPLSISALMRECKYSRDLSMPCSSWAVDRSENEVFLIRAGLAAFVQYTTHPRTIDLGRTMSYHLYGNFISTTLPGHADMCFTPASSSPYSEIDQSASISHS